MTHNALNQVKASFPTEAECLQYLEKLRWNGIVTSPFKANSKVYYCSLGKYKCRDSGKYFNAKTGTMFHHSRISLQKWFMAIWLMAIEKNAITSVDMAKELGITQKSAWYMMQKIRDQFNLKKVPVSRRKMASQHTETPIDTITDADKLNLVDWLNMFKK
jgi:transposase-like protein